MSLGSFLGGALSLASNFIPGGGLAKNLVQGGLGLLGAGHGASQVNQGNQLLDQATQAKLKAYNALDPVRQKAIAQALAGAPQRQDLSQIFRDPTNPFSRPMGQPQPYPQAGAPAASPAPAAPPMAQMPGTGQGGGMLGGNGPMGLPGPVGGAASGLGGVFGHTVGMADFLKSSPGFAGLMAKARGGAAAGAAPGPIRPGIAASLLNRPEGT